MAIFRSLFLTTKNGKTVKTRPYFTTIITTTTTPSTTVTTTILYTPLSNRPTLLSKWIAPFQGPLFLSFPPWKLSQFATPLNGVVLRRVRSLNLDLIRSGAKFPPKLGLDSGLSGQNVLDRIDTKDELKGKDDIGSDGFVKSFVNLPNLVSMARLVSGPFIGWMITNELYSSAFLALAVSGATDWLDGYLARRMKIDSVVGSYLDPLADKVLIGCVALAMVQMDLLHPGLVGIVVFRDVGLVGGAVYQRGSSLGWKWKSWSDFFNLDGTCPQKVEPLFLSKVNTVFQLVLVAAALLQPEFGTPETQPYITYLSLLVASTTVASTAAYGAQYIRKRSALLTRNP